MAPKTRVYGQASFRIRITWLLAIALLAAVAIPACSMPDDDSAASDAPLTAEMLASKVCNPQFAADVKAMGILEHANPDWTQSQYLNGTGAWANELDRQRWLHQNQGTSILPLSWLLALESNQTSFLADDNLADFGYLPDHNRGCNPFELPVGMAIQGSFESEIAGGVLAKEPASFGYSCASCHTTPLRIGGKETRVLGGAGLANQSGFNKGLITALATAASDLTRYIGRIRQIQTKLYGAAESPDAIVAALKRVQAGARPTEVFGAGRLDALGNGGNFMFDRYLERFHGQADMAKANRVPLEAPVGMPPIYDTYTFDWSYYGHSFRDPFTRALAETVAVSAPTALLPPDSVGPWNTTASAAGLLWLEKLLRQLEAPAYPELQPDAAVHPIGATYAELRVEGEKLYWDEQIGCARCHGQKNDAAPGKPVTKRWEKGMEFRLNSLPIGVIGTDPNNVVHFAQRTVTLPPNILEGLGRTSPLGTGSMIDPGATNPREVVVLESLLVGVSENLFRQEGWGSYPNAPTGKGLEATLGRQACDDPATAAPGECARIRPWISDASGKHDSVIFKPAEGYDAFDPRCDPAKDGAEACRALRERTGWLVYRARPLQGIWASAPFLHNNSVQSLCALLGNADLSSDARFVRAATFHVGNPTFDGDCVGFVDSPTIEGDKPASLLDTTKPGNSNKGHLYDASYKGTPAAGVVGPPLTKRQIFGIIEYLKSPSYKM